MIPHSKVSEHLQNGRHRVLDRMFFGANHISTIPVRTLEDIIQRRVNVTICDPIEMMFFTDNIAPHLPREMIGNVVRRLIDDARIARAK